MKDRGMDGVRVKASWHGGTGGTTWRGSIFLRPRWKAMRRTVIRLLPDHDRASTSTRTYLYSSVSFHPSRRLITLRHLITLRSYT